MAPARLAPVTLDDELGPHRVGDLTRHDYVVDEGVVIHPTAQVANTAEWLGHETRHEVVIGARSIVRAFVTIDAGVNRPTVVGADVLLMAHVHVGHDVYIGDRAQLAPGAVIGGSAILGDDVKVGMNATVLPWREIGDGARIGAGAVVTHDVPAGEVWAGNPARRLHL